MAGHNIFDDHDDTLASFHIDLALQYLGPLMAHDSSCGTGASYESSF
jgi:hypothetical protein